MKMRSLGQNGPLVSELGLGCMGMSDLYGPADRAESLATIHQALAAGVTLLDTGDFYGMGHNEMLLAEALQGRRRGGVVLSVKFGAQRGPGGDWLGYDARPQAVKTAAAYSLKRLGTDYIDIYRPARVDPAVPIEDTVGEPSLPIAGAARCAPCGAIRREACSSSMWAFSGSAGSVWHALLQLFEPCSRKRIDGRAPVAARAERAAGRDLGRIGDGASA